MAAYILAAERRLGSRLLKVTKLLLYRKDHVRSKLRPFHVKIMVCRSLNLAVGHLLKKKMEKISVWPISVYAASDVF